MIECIACRPYSMVNVCAIAFCNLSENLAGRRIVRWEGLAGSGIHPLTVDQHLSWFVDELRDVRMNLRGNCNAHTSSLVKQILASENDAGRRKATAVC